MAVAIGNKTVDLNTPSASTRTFSHNGSVGANGYLFVYVAMSNAVSISGVTYNGVAMTQISNQTTANTLTIMAIYRLAAPATGANNVVVTFSAGQYNPVLSFAASATGSSGEGNIVFDDTSTSPNSTSITISTNSIIFGALVAGNGTGHVIELPTGTSRTLEFTSAINNSTSGAFSATGLTSGSKNVQVSAAANLAGLYLEIKEAVAAASTQGMMMFM